MFGWYLVCVSRHTDGGVRTNCEGWFYPSTCVSGIQLGLVGGRHIHPLSYGPPNPTRQWAYYRFKLSHVPDQKPSRRACWIVSSLVLALPCVKLTYFHFVIVQVFLGEFSLPMEMVPGKQTQSIAAKQNSPWDVSTWEPQGRLGHAQELDASWESGSSLPDVWWPEIEAKQYCN